MSAWSKIAVVAVLVILVGVAIALRQQGTAAAPAEPGKAGATAVRNVPPPSGRMPRFVDFGADKCIACKMMTGVIDALQKEHGDRLEVYFVDVWENPSEARRFRVDIIPTQVFFDASGKELYRHQGYISKDEVIAKWKELGFNLQEGQHE